jgi:hypothetical protein
MPGLTRHGRRIVKAGDSGGLVALVAMLLLAGCGGGGSGGPAENGINSAPVASATSEPMSVRISVFR